ncbi:MAG: ribonuclease HI [Chloroflexota bacterium]
MSGAVHQRSFGLEDLDEFRSRLVDLRAELQPAAGAADYLAYTDGACFGNPSGPGGWAAAFSPHDDRPGWELWGHLSSTSNNRAEALGVLAALEWVPPGSRLTVRSDSQLTVRVFEGQYKAKANPDIWDEIRTTRTQKRLSVTIEWLRGHAGDRGNELADRLSKLGALKGDTARLEGLEAAPVRKTQSKAAELLGLEPGTDWERDFVRSVSKQLGDGRPLSDKQRAIVERIRARDK